jgi:hypothetical protein
MIGEIERDAAVAIAERFDADPHHLTRRGDRVEVRGIVDVQTRGQDLGLEDRRRQRRSLELFDRVEQRVGAVTALDDALPGGDETAEDRGIDRFHFVPQLGERSPAEHSENGGVSPLASCTARTKFAFDQTPFSGDARQDSLGRGGSEAVPRR